MCIHPFSHRFLTVHTIPSAQLLHDKPFNALRAIPAFDNEMRCVPSGFRNSLSAWKKFPGWQPFESSDSKSARILRENHESHIKNHLSEISALVRNPYRLNLFFDPTATCPSHVILTLRAWWTSDLDWFSNSLAAHWQDLADDGPWLCADNLRLWKFDDAFWALW